MHAGYNFSPSRKMLGLIYERLRRLENLIVCVSENLSHADIFRARGRRDLQLGRAQMPPRSR